MTPSEARLAYDWGKVEEIVLGTLTPEMVEKIMRFGMKIAEHSRPPFDPHVRTREAKPLVVSFTPDDWGRIERVFGKHINGMEIRELIMGVMAGEYKIIKR